MVNSEPSPRLDKLTKPLFKGETPSRELSFRVLKSFLFCAELLLLLAFKFLFDFCGIE